MGAGARAPKVSVGLPVHNGESYLEGCLRCLLGQSFADFEVVVSDNGSTDRTEAICREFAGRDGRVRVLREERNRGSSWNFNRVLEESRGTYFKWAAYDDLISAGFVEACVRVLDEDAGCVLSHGAATLIDAEGAEREEYPERMRLDAPRPSRRLREFLHKVGLTNAIYGLIRMEALRRTRGYGSYVNADQVMLAELALHGTFREAPGARFYRRLHAQASGPSNPGWTQLAAWYDPGRAGMRVFPNWRHFAEYLAAIGRAPVGWLEKARCLRELLAWERPRMGVLAREALAACLPPTGRRAA